MKLRCPLRMAFDPNDYNSPALDRIRGENAKVIYYVTRIAEQTKHSYNYVRSRAGQIAHDHARWDLLTVLAKLDSGEIAL